jgi:hypothetical protein
MTTEELSPAALLEEFETRLSTDEPTAVLLWLVSALESLTPVQRSANATLVAYTGRPEAIAWLENHVASPVKDSWGVAAALLGVPWPRIKSWLMTPGAKRLMGLDALYAVRSPAPNMAPLHQIASPVLVDAPSMDELEDCLSKVMESSPTPRIESMTAAIRKCSADILAIRSRNVPVTDMPKLYFSPHDFPGAVRVLADHAEIAAGIRKSVEDVLREHETRTRH